MNKEFDNTSHGGLLVTQKKVRVPIPAAIKRELYIECGYRCSVPRCPAEATLEIHHINEDPSDNRPENLLVLCANHHGQATKGTIDRKACKTMKEAIAEAPTERVVDHEKLAKLLAADLASGDNWPPALAPETSMQDLASEVNRQLGLHPELVVKRPPTILLWVRGLRGPWDKIKAQVLAIACLACGYQDVEFVEVGLSKSQSFVGSTGLPLSQALRFRMPAAALRGLQDGQLSSRDVWRVSHVLAVQDENTADASTTPVAVDRFEEELA